MPSCCSVPGCRSNYKTEIEVVKVFQFPSDPERRALWLRTIARTGWIPGKRSVVCIKHFKPEDVVKIDSVERPDGSYLVVPRTNLKLKPSAVPCVFDTDEESLLTPEDPDDRLEEGAKENIEELYADDINSVSEMPFFWKPDNKRTQISPERMKSAVIQVVIEGKSIRSASKEHRIDRKTLGRYVQKYRNTKDEEIELKPNYSSAQIFTDAEETLLEEYLTLAAEIHNGLTSKVARQIAYEHGIAHKKVLPDNWYATKCASYDWLRGFLHRHRSFSLKNPHAVGGAYEYPENIKSKNKFIAEVFESEYNIANVHHSKFMANLDKSGVSCVYDTNSVKNVDESGASNVCNSKLIAGVDESGVSSVRHSKKVISEQFERKVPNELSKTVHDPECLLNTTGSSNFTPFCTCQDKSENHVSITPINNVSITPINNVSITPINNVPNPEDIYILPTTDEPSQEDAVSAATEESESFSEGTSTRRNYKRKGDKSPELSNNPTNKEIEKELDLKESKRTRRKRKL